MESDEDDFVFYGTPIEREDDLIGRKKKAVAESSGQLRTLPAWKQEVRIYSLHRRRELIGRWHCFRKLPMHMAKRLRGFGFVSYCEIRN